MKLPSSYDIIGNIAILPEKTKNSKNIAKKLLELKQITTVVIKTGIHYGNYRLQKTKILAGKKSKTTLHKESNCRFKLNIDKTYFTPRLSEERLRISKLIKKDEDILVIGSGIGIYPIILSKNSKAKKIVGIEINPQAHKFAKENLILNKIDNVNLINKDAKKTKLNKKFNRIILPIPHTSKEYLPLLKNFLKPKGIVHFYTFQKENLENFKILKETKCGQASPGKYRICLDLLRV